MAYYGPAGRGGGGWYYAGGGADTGYLYGRDAIHGASGLLGAGWAAQGLGVGQVAVPAPAATSMHQGYYAGGGGDAGYMYGRGAVHGASGLLGAGWAAQGRGIGQVAVPAPAVTGIHQGYQGWNVGEQYLRELAPKPPTPPLAMIRRDTMRTAEAAAHEVLLLFHPTEEEEKRRHEIIAYAKQLIGTSLGCEVFTFGSVPLKTYLPDGDIDLTVLTNTSADLSFIYDVIRILKIDQQHTDSRFSPKEVQFIDAEVKLIKCEIDNTIVDISFNQIGGVSTVCFLELVDRQVGKNHLFKRSIMLIKAWCHNECHILGAYNRLLSTYALEILVLHIFNVFHKSLHGPLEALYKFLEYYSKFDWDKYGLTLDGPIPLSSLCNFAVKPTSTNDDLLLGKESLKGSFDRLLLLPSDFDRHQEIFCPKHLNIVDPLKVSNNLGRSINKVNSYHIRGAFLLGAQKLGQILLLPCELVSDEIYDFFEETLKKYGEEQKKDIVVSGVLQSPETALRKDISRLEISYISEDKNKSLDNSMDLPDKESKLKEKIHKISGKKFQDDAKDSIWKKILSIKSADDYYEMVSEVNISSLPSYLTNFTTHSFFYQDNGNDSIKRLHNNCATEEDLSLSHILTSSTRISTLGVSSSCPDGKSNCTEAHQEKTVLPSLPPLNLLDLSGDLYLHLECLRHVQYNLEAMFDDFHKRIQEASLAGLLNEDCFEVPLLKFSSNTNTAATPPRLPLPSSTDTARRNLSPLYCSHSTEDVCQQSNTEVHGDSANQENVSLSSRTPSPPSISFFMIVPLSSGVEVVAADWLDLAVPSSPTSVIEGNHDSRVYMTWDVSKSRGTGTYIPRMNCGYYRNRMPRKYTQSQPERVHPSSQHTASGSVRSPQTPTRQSSSKQHVPKAAHPAPFKAGAPTSSGTKQIPEGQLKKALDSQQQRAENVTPALLPPRLALPRHNGYAAQGNHVTVPTIAGGQSSSPDASGKDFKLIQETLEFINHVTVPTTIGGQSSSPAAGGKDFKLIDLETLEFGTLGTFSPTLLKPRFIEDFPALQRVENGTSALLPPRLALPRHGGNADQGNHVTVPTIAGSQSSSPAAGGKDFKLIQEETLKFGNHVTVPTTANGQSSSPASGGKDFKLIDGETLEFETLGTFFPTLLKPKFIKDFPPLTPNKMPLASTPKSWPIQAPASTLQIPKINATAAQGWSREAPAFTVQSPKAQISPLEAHASSPRPAASGAQSRPEKLYQLKDTTDFPPLQARTH